MRHLAFILLAMTLSLVSCHHTNEPPKDTTLPIIRQYVPETTIFQRSDTEFVDRIKWLDGQKFVVDSEDGFPDDKLGFSNAYTGIDFSRYTLLLCYTIYGWSIDSYENRYYRDNISGTYNWQAHLGTSTITDSPSDTLRITRLAILVQKIPENVDLNISVGWGVINWGWKE